jgi:hypothetical protein
MPPLLCLSPCLLDQSFPRDLDELQRVASALGELQQHLEKNEAHLVSTEPLEEIVEIFDWDYPELSRIYPLLQSIYDLLNQWFLLQNDRLVRIRAPEELAYQLHPIPEGTQNQGLVGDWSREVGKMFSLHSTCIRGRREFFIGVACDRAFADEKPGKYEDSNAQAFPLVGPDTIRRLSDAYEWDVPHDIRSKSVRVRDAYKNCSALGAVNVEFPVRDSHYKITFRGGHRPWVLDENDDPVPPPYLRELIGMTGYPLEVIIYALINGEMPRHRLRLWKYQIPYH